MRHKVLIVLHSDGYIEAYADKEHVDVRTVVMPHAPGAETLAEEYIELTVPRPYREIYFPGNRRAVDAMRTLLPSDIVQQKLDREFVTILADLQRDIEKEHQRVGHPWELNFDE